jgi:hypothetical protein
MAVDDWVSSTRAETAALAAVLVALRPALKDGASITVHIDNATVVRHFNQKTAWRAKGWSKLKDRDMWDIIVGVLEKANATGAVRVHKVAAHQDTREQKAGPFKGKVRPPEDLSEQEWGNVEADAVVGRMRGAPLIADLAMMDEPRRATRRRGRPALWPAQARLGRGDRWYPEGVEALEAHAAQQSYQRLLEDTTSRELVGKWKDWMCSREWARGQHLKQAWWGPRKARRDIQISHNQLPTRLVVSRRHCPVKEAGLCPECGCEETQWHAIGRCNHVASVGARRKGKEKMEGVIDDAKCRGGCRETLLWLYTGGGAYLDLEGAPPKQTGESWRRQADAMLATNARTLGPLQLWAGTLPNGLHGKLVHDGGMGEDAADKLLATLAWRRRATYGRRGASG